MSAKVKASIFTITLFGGLAYFLFGGAIPDLPKFDFLENIFSKKETTPSPKKRKTKKPSGKEGQVIDSYKGVNVYFNGSVGNVFGRNTTQDGYNLGLKYQCVEFGKRFFYQAYNHKMPNAGGNAKDFFNRNLSNGDYNSQRGMYQFRNGGVEKPKKDDMGIIGASPDNKFGHLFIITNVDNSSVDFVQQNPGSRNPSRGKYQLIYENGRWTIKAANLLGWLRIN